MSRGDYNLSTNEILNEFHKYKQKGFGVRTIGLDQEPFEIIGPTMRYPVNEIENLFNSDFKLEFGNKSQLEYLAVMDLYLLFENSVAKDIKNFIKF